MIINPVTIGADATIAEHDEGVRLLPRLRPARRERRGRAGRHHHQPRYPLHVRGDFENIRVRDIADPMPLVTARPGVSKDEAFALLSHNKIERLPSWTRQASWPV